MDDHEKYAARAFAREPRLLFVVQRSTNKNAVGYWLDPEQQRVRAEWFMFERDSAGGAREALTDAERAWAFGVTQKGVQFRVRAMADHVLQLGKHGERHVAIMSLEGKHVVVQRVWVQLKTVLGLQTFLPDFICVAGVDSATGDKVRIRLAAPDAEAQALADKYAAASGAPR